MRIKGFPLGGEIGKFIDQHEQIFVIEQNRDSQMRTLLSTELNIDPNRLTSVLCFDGLSITAKQISTDVIHEIEQQIPNQEVV